MNDSLEAEKCVIENFHIDSSLQKKLIRKFVEDDLCSCAIETFDAFDNRNVELTMEALYRAVINEMVLRCLATSANEQ